MITTFSPEPKCCLDPSTAPLKKRRGSDRDDSVGRGAQSGVALVHRLAPLGTPPQDMGAYKKTYLDFVIFS